MQYHSDLGRNILMQVISTKKDRTVGGNRAEQKIHLTVGDRGVTLGR